VHADRPPWYLHRLESPTFAAAGCLTKKPGGVRSQATIPALRSPGTTRVRKRAWRQPASNRAMRKREPNAAHRDLVATRAPRQDSMCHHPRNVAGLHVWLAARRSSRWSGAGTTSEVVCRRVGSGCGQERETGRSCSDARGGSRRVATAGRSSSKYRRTISSRSIARARTICDVPKDHPVNATVMLARHQASPSFRRRVVPVAKGIGGTRVRDRQRRAEDMDGARHDAIRAARYARETMPTTCSRPRDSRGRLPSDRSAPTPTRDRPGGTLATAGMPPPT